MIYLSIFFGGGLGALLRFLISSIISAPLATFFVNIVGSFIIGFLYVFFLEKSDINPAIKLALTVGFCGGLTTFSTFSLELFKMLGNQQFLQAFIYVLLSVTICLTATAIGVYCAKIF